MPGTANPEVVLRRAQFDAMDLAVRAGGWPYRPLDGPGSTPRDSPFWQTKANWDRITQDLGFGGDRSCIDGDWRWARQLGQGSFGNASLWTKHAANGDVIDRKVVKDVYAVLHGNDWDDPCTWSGPVAQRVPLEYNLQRKACQSLGGDTVVRVDGYGTYEDNTMYRLYSEYCPHGDLEDVIQLYVALGYQHAAIAAFGIQETTPPSRMLWAIFEALVSALCIMQQGHLPSQPPPTTPYQGVIHHDLKPSNIFLAKPLRDFWADIPIAKVGDFGLAVPLNSARAQSQGAGTRGYQAPEPVRDAVVTPQGSKTDVWVVGRIMLSLMRLNTSRDVTEVSMNTPMPGLTLEERPNFPAGMVDLVHRCLNREHMGRPTASELWVAINLEVGVGRAGLFSQPLRMRGRVAGEPIIYMNPDDVYGALT